MRSNKKGRNSRRSNRKNTMKLKGKRKFMKRMMGGQGSKTLHFYNINHYGDSILNLKLFYINKAIIKERGIQIHYYYNSEYIKNRSELERYVDPAVVQLHTLSEKSHDGIELSMGNPIGKLRCDSHFEEYIPEFYKQIVGYLGLQDLNIDTSLYQPEEYLKDIYAKLDSKYHNLDVLIINAEPQSGQPYDKAKMDDLCIKLSKKYRVATTTPVNSDILCTFNDGLKLQDIGAISTHAKNIVSMFSGPITACFNSETRNTVKKWFVISGYRLNGNFISISFENLEEILGQIAL